jgi:hypothetical protein
VFRLRTLYNKLSPTIAKNIIRAIRLHINGFNVYQLPDISLIIAIYNFAGRTPPPAREVLDYYFNSSSQIHQDLLAHLLCKTRYFVEFGACDGIEGSNTLFLEKRDGVEFLPNQA